MLNVADTPFLRTVFLTVLGVIALGCIAALVYGVVSKRFTDKLLAVNLITTLSLNAVCILAVFLNQDYILDIALIYALLSFVAVVVLCKLLSGKERKEENRND